MTALKAGPRMLTSSMRDMYAYPEDTYVRELCFSRLQSSHPNEVHAREPAVGQAIREIRYRCLVEIRVGL